MNNLEIKIGNFTLKGIYIAIFVPLLSSIGGGVWYVSDFYNRINAIDALANSNATHGGSISDLEARLASVEQSIQDNDISSLQGKLGEIGANLTLIMEAQAELMDLKDRFKDVEVGSKENEILVQSYEDRVQFLEEQIKRHRIEIEDLWKALDAVSNPLG